MFVKTEIGDKLESLYKGHSVIRIPIPAQSEMSFVGDKAFTRKDFSTVEVKGQELLAVSKLFQKRAI